MYNNICFYVEYWEFEGIRSVIATTSSSTLSHQGCHEPYATGIGDGHIFNKTIIDDSVNVESPIDIDFTKKTEVRLCSCIPLLILGITLDKGRMKC